MNFSDKSGTDNIVIATAELPDNFWVTNHTWE